MGKYKGSICPACENGRLVPDGKNAGLCKNCGSRINWTAYLNRLEGSNESFDYLEK